MNIKSDNAKPILFSGPMVRAIPAGKKATESAAWTFVDSAALVNRLKAREDSWDQLGHLALLIVNALEEQTSDSELEKIEDRAREAHRSVLRRGS